MSSPHMLLRLSVLVAALWLASCTNSRAPAPEMITVEGGVTVRGNEPFAAYVLQTEADTFYVLRFPDIEAPETPARLRVTGRLYEGGWDGRSFAHIDVQEYEEM